MVPKNTHSISGEKFRNRIINCERSGDNWAIGAVGRHDRGGLDVRKEERNVSQASNESIARDRVPVVVVKTVVPVIRIDEKHCCKKQRPGGEQSVLIDLKST